MKLTATKALICLLLLLGVIAAQTLSNESDPMNNDEKSADLTNEQDDDDDESSRAIKKNKQLYLYLTQHFDEELTGLLGQLGRHVQKILSAEVTCVNVVKVLEDQLEQHKMVRELYFDPDFYFSSIENALKLISRIQQSAYSESSWKNIKSVFEDFMQEFERRSADLELNDPEAHVFDHFFAEQISNTLQMIHHEYFDETEKITHSKLNGLSTCFLPFFIQVRRLILNTKQSLHKVGDILADDIRRLADRAATCGHKQPIGVDNLIEEIRKGVDHQVYRLGDQISLAEIEEKHQNERVGAASMDLWVDIVGSPQGDKGQDTNSVVEFQVVPRAPAAGAKDNKTDNATARAILGEPVGNDDKDSIRPAQNHEDNLTVEHNPQTGRFEDEDQKSKLEPEKVLEHNLTARKDPQVGKLEDPDEKKKLEPQKVLDYNLTAKKDPQVGKLEDEDSKQKLEPQKLRDFNLTAKKDPQVGKLEDEDAKQKLEPQKLRDFNLTAKKDPQVGKLEDEDSKQKLEPQKLRDFNLTAKKDPQVGKLENPDEKKILEPQKVIEHNLTTRKDPQVGKLEDEDAKQKLEPQKVLDFNLTTKKDPQVGKLEDEETKRKVPPQKVVEHNLTVDSNPSVGEGVTKDVDGVPTPRNYDYRESKANEAISNLHDVTKRLRKASNPKKKLGQDPEHIAGTPKMDETGTPSSESPKPPENIGYPQPTTTTTTSKKAPKTGKKKALPERTGFGEPAQETVNGPQAETTPGAAKDANEFAKVAPDPHNHAGDPRAEKVNKIFRPHPNHNHTDYAQVKPDEDRRAGKPTIDSVNGAAAAIVPGAAKDALKYREVKPDGDNRAGEPTKDSVNGAAAAVVPGAAKDALAFKEVKPDQDRRAGEPTKDSVNGAAAAVVPGAAKDAIAYREVKPDEDNRAGEPTKDSVNGAAAAVVPGAAKDAVAYKSVVPDKDDHAGRVKAEKVTAIFRPHPNHNYSEYAKVQPSKEGPGSPTTESLNGAAAAVVPGAAKDALSYKEVKPDSDNRAGKPTTDSVNGAAAAVVPGAAKDAESFKEVKPDGDDRVGDPTNEKKVLENYPAANPSHDEPNLAFEDDKSAKKGPNSKAVKAPKRLQSPTQIQKQRAEKEEKEKMGEQRLGGPMMQRSHAIPTVPTRLRERKNRDSMPIASMEAPGANKKDDLPQIPREVNLLKREKAQDNVGVPEMSAEREVLPDVPTKMKWQDHIDEEPTASPAIIQRRAPIANMDEDLDLIEDAAFESDPDASERRHRHRRLRGSRGKNAYILLQAPITPPSDPQNEEKQAAEEHPVDMSISQSPRGKEYKTTVVPKSTTPMVKKKTRQSSTAAPVESINPNSRSRSIKDLGIPINKGEKNEDELKSGDVTPIEEDHPLNGDETMAPGVKADAEEEQIRNPDATPMNEKLVNKMVEMQKLEGSSDEDIAAMEKDLQEDEE